MTSATIAELVRRSPRPTTIGFKLNILNFPSQVACLIRVPVEIAKQRRQTLNGQFSNSALRILVEAYKADGLRKGLYRGFGSTIIREIPFSFIQIPIWEYLKANFSSNTGYPLTPVSVALCGAIAGGCAAAITTPLDVAKTRIMLAEKYEGRKLNIGYILRSIYAEKGITGWVRGNFVWWQIWKWHLPRWPIYLQYLEQRLLSQLFEITFSG